MDDEEALLSLLLGAHLGPALPACRALSRNRPQRETTRSLTVSRPHGSRKRKYRDDEQWRWPGASPPTSSPGSRPLTTTPPPTASLPIFFSAWPSAAWSVPHSS